MLNKNIKKAKTLPSEFYYSREKFDDLKEKVFAKNWQFICDTSKLTKEGDAIPYDFIKGYLITTFFFVFLVIIFLSLWEDFFYPYKDLFPGVIFVLFFIRLLNPFLTREKVATVRFPETEPYEKGFADHYDKYLKNKVKKFELNRIAALKIARRNFFIGLPIAHFVPWGIWRINGFLYDILYDVLWGWPYILIVFLGPFVISYFMVNSYGSDF